MLTINQLIGFGAGGGGNVDFVGSRAVDSTGTIPTTGLTGGIDTQARLGDLLLVSIGETPNGDTSLAVTDATLPWTEIAELFADDSTDTNMSVNYAVATVEPPANITTSVSTEGHGGILMVFRSQNATPLDVTSTTATGINASAPDPAAITPATSGATVVVFGASGNTGEYTLTAAPPGYDGFTTFTDVGGLRDHMQGAAYKANCPAGVAENPSAFTASGTDAGASWAAVTVAIRPA